ncbi:alpha-endosulfine-like [Octopus sinensis]|uniref:Alpha-endosulfine-like n=1 Tax=Octopus sinensis TaxID=2607531 RepID=A0A6P7U4D0_9MOLL|nr:alpha-endosulfine-like [Octopus sinensis]
MGATPFPGPITGRLRETDKTSVPEENLPPNHASIIQRKLRRQNIYFDSGDYNMAKAQLKPGVDKDAALKNATGSQHPTPADIPRKLSDTCIMDPNVSKDKHN